MVLLRLSKYSGVAALDSRNEAPAFFQTMLTWEPGANHHEYTASMLKALKVLPRLRW